MLGDGMGYIRIASFSENTGKEFKAAYESLAEQGMKGLIIDLRENPGGPVHELRRGREPRRAEGTHRLGCRARRLEGSP